MVGDVVAGSNKKFLLVPFSAFRVRWGNRPEVYRDFDILCHVNTTQGIGCAVCKLVITRRCSARGGTKQTLQRSELYDFMDILQCINWLVSLTATPRINVLSNSKNE